MLEQDQSLRTGDAVKPVSLQSSLPPVVRGLACSLRIRARTAPKHANKVVKRIERFIAEGRTRDATRLARLLTHSYDAKLVALRDANERLPKGCRVKGAELHRIAGELNLRQIQGSATYRAQGKPKGGFRPVMNFTLPARGAQLLLKRAIQPFLLIRPDQYAIKQGGRPAACRRIMDHAALGYMWFAECDVKKCYASVQTEGVTKLLGGNLKRMMEANAFSKNVQASFRRTKEKVTANDISNLSKEVRTGIPQGSLLSPSIAEAVMACVLDQATQRSDWPDVKLTNYADNIGILGRNTADVERAADILKGALMRSQFGPLKLLCKGVRSIRQGFDFLGTRFIAKRRRIRAELSPTAMSKCLKWFSAALENRELPLSEIKRRMRCRSAAMALSQDGRSLTRATQWTNAVWSYALDRQLRGRDLHTQARWHHRALHEPGLAYAF